MLINETAARRYWPTSDPLLSRVRIGGAWRRVVGVVAEAGTGVGKTFAYLVPLLLSGRRALISTATKSLQDQLFLRDLPRLRDAPHLVGAQVEGGVVHVQRPEDPIRQELLQRLAHRGITLHRP